MVEIWHPVDTLHISLLQLHRFWHPFPHVGYGHGDEQFSPVKPCIQTEKINK